jgi:PAS domain S-box-containing protein
MSAHILSRDGNAEALIASELRYRRLFETARDGILILDALTGMIVDVNPFLIELLGLSRDAFLRRKIWELGFFKDIAANEAKFEELQAQEYIRYEDLPLETADGRKISVEFVSNVYLVNHHKVIQCNIRDITARKRLEAAQRDSERLAYATFDALSAHIAVIDETGKILAVNRAWRAFALANPPLGANVNEGTNYLSVCDAARGPDSGEASAVADGIRAVIKGERGEFETEYPCHAPDVRRWFVCRVSRSFGPGAARVVIAHENITLRKESEQQLRQLSRAVEQSPTSIVITDTKGDIEYVNPKFTQITGYSFDEARGKNPSILKSGETPPDTYKALWDTIKAGGEWRGEFHNRKKNGELFWERASISAITDRTGEITHFLAVKEDITEHKKLAEQFLRAQRIENIGRLASGVAHDLNNILAPIMMASSILNDDLPPETHQKLVFSIQEAAQRGADIVRQVLTFARGVEGQRTTLRPQLLVAQVENILRETFPKSIAFTVNVPKDLWTVSGDVTQMHQVLLNLCVNARDAMMPGGGTLVIAAENIEIDENYAAMTHDAKPGRYVVLKVIDSGCGIPPGVLDKIFDPFFTTKEKGKGTGLGLSTVVGIVKSHGGFMEVESHAGGGSVFRVFIPADVESLHIPAPAELPAVPEGHGETVLLVDDEHEILKVAAMVLTQNGYMVMTACDGIEALTIFVKHSEFIKVVVTDVSMPMMDGVNLTQALKRITPGVKIIAASGHAEESRENELRALGIRAFLPKPFNKHQLLEAVHNAFACK